jgi:hypothetical protein
LTDPVPFGHALDAALQRLGIADLDVLMELDRAWDEIAGSPWSGVSRPVVLRRGELVVEAGSGPAAGLLRYAVGDLHRRLDGRFGPGVVAAITVRVTFPGGAG